MMTQEAPRKCARCKANAAPDKSMCEKHLSQDRERKRTGNPVPSPETVSAVDELERAAVHLGRAARKLAPVFPARAKLILDGAAEARAWAATLRKDASRDARRKPSSLMPAPR
jgi:hypothetical protein